MFVDVAQMRLVQPYVLPQCTALSLTVLGDAVVGLVSVGEKRHSFSALPDGEVCHLYLTTPRAAVRFSQEPFYTASMRNVQAHALHIKSS